MGLFPIDIVYLWVDGSDPAWRAKLNRHKVDCVLQSEQVSGESRWRNNDELRYSLRSIELYAPWINHIYIVTDNQCPEWLDTNNPKISIIDHRDILPNDALPVFNSQAIESCIYKIPGLSEHFILGNDDTMFVMPTTPDPFFKEDGTAIVRLIKFHRYKAQRRGTYQRTIRRMQDTIHRLFGLLIPYAPHHNFDAYLKSDYKYCVENLEKEAWERTARNKFRTEEDMQRCFISYYMIVAKHAELRKVGRYNRVHGFWNAVQATFTNRFANDSRNINLDLPDYEAALNKYNPIMICTNDSERAKDEDGLRMKKFLEELFPKKCSFEK